MTHLPTEGGVEYRPAIGFDGVMVGSDGSIWSSRSRSGWKLLKQHARYDGLPYRRICLRKSRSDQKLYCLYVHILVAEAFLGSKNEGDQCRHLDGDVSNNRLSNLVWGTPMENHQDKERHGTIPRGSRHTNAKLTDSQVVEIRKSFSGGERQCDIARRYGVAQGTINGIVRNRTRTRLSSDA